MGHSLVFIFIIFYLRKERIIKKIQIDKLKKMGYGVEIMVIDNGSKDKTRYIANNHGAKVIVQPIKGYGNAYKAGFANATGNIIITGDADLTYPFNDLPKIIKKLSLIHISEPTRLGMISYAVFCLKKKKKKKNKK